MAANDWNGNRNNNFKDDFIEYSLCSASEAHTSDSSENELSTIDAIIVMFNGLLRQVLIFNFLEIEIDDVPVVVM